jgi:hypothetical protein
VVDFSEFKNLKELTVKILSLRLIESIESIPNLERLNIKYNNKALVLGQLKFTTIYPLEFQKS